MDFFKPGSTLKRSDPKAHTYEHSRARDAYRKQIEIFKIRINAEVDSHTRFDFDAKQEVRIKAKRLREQCLKNYREGLQGLATTNHRREYKDTFLGAREATFEMHDFDVLDYELRLTEEIDAIIKNLSLLKEDKSNRETIEWMCNLAKQKLSYEAELPIELVKPEASAQDDLLYERYQPVTLNDNNESVVDFSDKVRDYRNCFENELDKEGNPRKVYQPFDYLDDEADIPTVRYAERRKQTSEPQEEEPSNYTSGRSFRGFAPYQPDDELDEPPGLCYSRYNRAHNVTPYDDFDDSVSMTSYRRPSVNRSYLDDFDECSSMSNLSLNSYNRPYQPPTRFRPQRFQLDPDDLDDYTSTASGYSARPNRAKGYSPSLLDDNMTMNHKMPNSRRSYNRASFSPFIDNRSNQNRFNREYSPLVEDYDAMDSSRKHNGNTRALSPFDNLDQHGVSTFAPSNQSVRGYSPSESPLVTRKSKSTTNEQEQLTKD